MWRNSNTNEIPFGTTLFWRNDWCAEDVCVCVIFNYWNLNNHSNRNRNPFISIRAREREIERSADYFLEMSDWYTLVSKAWHVDEISMSWRMAQKGATSKRNYLDELTFSVDVSIKFHNCDMWLCFHNFASKGAREWPFHIDADRKLNNWVLVR